MPMSLTQVAKQTLAILEAGSYTTETGKTVELAAAQAAAVAGARLYTPDELAALVARPGPGGNPLAPRVTDETTQVAAHRLAALEGRDDVVVLNFASARNHGGGFLGGARAQEEDLCRCSGLYPTLLAPAVQRYYQVHRAERSLLYSDHAIYSPRVPWFRTAGRGPLLESVFLASVITAPAPNAGPLLRRDPDAGPAIAETFARRWHNVLAIARDNGHRAVVLGAWGCGAFGNDAEVAAAAALPALGSAAFAGYFDEVVFAVPRQGKKSTANHDVFARVLPGQPEK